MRMAIERAKPKGGLMSLSRWCGMSARWSVSRVPTLGVREHQRQPHHVRDARLANEMAQRIAYDTRDWTVLRKTATFTGDGVTTAFDLAANYKRMLLTSNVWRSTSTQKPMRFVPDTDEWVQRRVSECHRWGEWTSWRAIHIWPVLALDRHRGPR